MHDSRDSSKRTKTSTSFISLWSSTPSIRASWSRKSPATSSICSWSKMSCKAACPSRSIWHLSWAHTSFNVSCPQTMPKTMIEIIFFAQPKSAITSRASTHTDMSQNSASCPTRQRIWSFALRTFTSSWKASDRLRRNSTTWTKPNGSICTASTFIPCWWAQAPRTLTKASLIGFLRLKWYLILISIPLHF